MKLSPNSRSAILRVCKLTIWVTLLTLIAKHVLLNWSAVAEVEPPAWSWVFVASIIAIIAWLVNAAVFASIIRSHGYQLSFSKSMGLYLVPMLGKYVPGKVWTFVASFVLFAKQGIPKKVAATATGLNMGLTLASAAALSAGFASGANVAPVGRLWVSAAALAIVFLIHPKVMYPAVNWGLRVVGREEIQSRLGFLGLLALFGGRTVAWCLFGIAFTFFVRSFSATGPDSFFQVATLFVFAQIAGIAAFFAPAGLGVRESVLVLGLSPVVGTGPAIVISGATRLWQTAIELTLTLFAWCGLRHAEDGCVHLDAGVRDSALAE